MEVTTNIPQTHDLSSPLKDHKVALCTTYTNIDVFGILSQTLPFQNEHLKFWWDTTARILNGMLFRAGYDIHERIQHLLLYYQFILPSLGRKPTTYLGEYGGQLGLPVWKSFMTDHHTPIEYSWAWDSSGIAGRQRPTVRFSIEPIGPLAGTLADPLNLYQFPAFLSQVTGGLHSYDSEWLELFAGCLTWTDETAFLHHTQETGKHPELKHRSQYFVALDLDKAGLVLKAYFIPQVRSFMTGVSCEQLVEDAILLAGGLDDAWKKVTTYFDTLTESVRPEVLIAGIDCLTPKESRVKVYVRAQCTTLESILNMLTLGGVLEGPHIQRCLSAVRELWEMLKDWSRTQGQHHGLHAGEEECLPRKNHLTQGILYYFELRRGFKTPFPKVYLPVRHYGTNDRQIAEGIGEFLTRQGCAGFSETSYLQSVQSIIQQRPLEKTNGIHTYITCAIKSKSYGFATYFGPQMYACEGDPNKTTWYNLPYCSQYGAKSHCSVRDYCI